MIYVLKQNIRIPMMCREEMIDVSNFSEARQKMILAVEHGADYQELWKDGKLVSHAHVKGSQIIITENS